jgi:hypothetical protein
MDEDYKEMEMDSSGTVTTRTINSIRSLGSF